MSGLQKQSKGAVNAANKKITIAVSACLLGEPVRYDGKHKKNTIVVDTLNQNFNFISLCPEVAIGLAVPRNTIQLVSVNNALHVQATDKPALDYTDALLEYAEKANQEFPAICGYILKARSPSCGLHTTPVINASVERSNKLEEKEQGLYSENKNIIANTNTFFSSGMFTQGLMQLSPTLPMIDEESLAVVEKRQEFIEKAYAYYEKNNGEDKL